MQLISAFVFAKRIAQSLYYLKPLAILSGCTAWFVSDLVGNPEDQLSHNEAHIIKVLDDILRIIFKLDLFNMRNIPFSLISLASFIA